MPGALDDRAVLATNAAYEVDAVAWSSRGLDRSYGGRRLDRFRELLAPGARVLDLGCGPGLDSVGLIERGLAVVGLDLTRAMLNVARMREGLRCLVQGDSRSLPLADASFAGVWASASLLHLPKSQVSEALGEVVRVLGAGGVFYSAMKEGDKDEFDAPAAGATVKSPRFFAHYRTSEWTALLEAAGFRILNQEIDADRRRAFPDWIVTLAVTA